uniref:Uncharacterized protein n=1 Tax=Anopheles quadriannulatus TaxID=34691 RepID=A0A182XT49_ANOQN
MWSRWNVPDRSAKEKSFGSLALLGADVGTLANLYLSTSNSFTWAVHPSLETSFNVIKLPSLCTRCCKRH